MTIGSFPNRAGINKEPEEFSSTFLLNIIQFLDRGGGTGRKAEGLVKKTESLAWYGADRQALSMASQFNQSADGNPDSAKAYESSARILYKETVSSHHAVIQPHIAFREL